MSPLATLFKTLRDTETEVDEKPLEELIHWVRPQSADLSSEVITRLEELIQYLEDNPENSDLLRSYLARVLQQYDLNYFFTEYTVLKKSGFFGQLRKRLFRKFIPELPKQKNLSQLVRRVFHHKKDRQWLEEVDPTLWQRLLDNLSCKDSFFMDEAIKRALLKSIKLLSFRIASFGLDNQIRTKYRLLGVDTDEFFDQNQALIGIYKLLEDDTDYESVLENIQSAIQLLGDCKDKINILRSRKNEIGTSSQLTFLSRQVSYHIDRLSLLLKIYSERTDKSFSEGLMTLLQESVEYQQQKNSIGNLINEYLDLVALQVVERNAQQGEKYIAETKSDYWKGLRASMLGGFIIAIFAMFKIFLYKAELPPFFEALVFSINYAACFILVKALGGIIATKQPAMTASSFIKNIDSKNQSEEILLGLRDVIIKVSHSQFISFVGNLVLAFPTAILITMAFTYWTDIEFVSAAKAEKLLKDLQPIQGGAIYYAAIAGVFLSLSGLISGYFDNKVVYSNIPARIKNLKWLQSFLNQKQLSRFAKYIEKKLGAFVGNASLGFFLGFAGFFGYITGLPIDIRHIAFSSANFGFIFDLNMNTDTLLICALSIYLIGLVNFLVSFGMTLSFALKARKVTFEQSRKLIWLVLKSFFRNPFRFLFPVGAPQS
jgi:site-specific recombinase